MGLAVTASEQLEMFRQFDRDDNGRVGWEEFRTFGAALLELASEHEAETLAQAMAARCAQTPPLGLGTPTSGGTRGTFARRGAVEEQRAHRAAGRIQV